MKQQIEPKTTIVKVSHSTLLDDKSSLPKADFTGSLPLGNVMINCAVLDDGRRVLAQRHVFVALDRNKNPGRGQASTSEGPAFLSAKNLEPFITDEVRALWDPIIYLSQGGYKGNQAFGYRAELLPLICGVFLDAAEAGATGKSQEKTVAACKKLIRGLATVGIVALVDEVTGYQEVRDKRALEEILRKYISPQLLPWQRFFPPEFYEQLFRLRNWDYKPMSVKRPILVGKLTNMLVYDRLGAKVKERLLEKVERKENGRLATELHRWLSTDEGRPALERHLHTVTALMRISPNWKHFISNLNVALPLPQGQRPLPLTFEEDEK
jgi:hypothetical protein